MKEEPTILIFEDDTRILGRTQRGNRDLGPNNNPGQPDWKVWAVTGFGRRLQHMLGRDSDYWAEVTDCGQYVAVTAGYHSVGAGRSNTKTFIISFDNPKYGDGKIFSSSTKWRTISNIDQAASYISSVIRSLANQANQTV